MRIPVTLLLPLAAICVSPTLTQTPNGADDLTAALKVLTDRLDSMQTTVRDLGRQTMLQQFAFEERIRSEGDSGVKIVRGTNKGLENYQEATHISNAFNSIHDHSNYDRTMGMGEIIAVLNGVEFRTRHNDYKLRMPSTSDPTYHATEPLPFPGVPPAVRNKANIDDQITEMRQWFKAFKEQDPSVRDYREYFKAALCYMEGAWTLDKELEEPFESDRHEIDASSWFELQDLVRYSSYTGTKSRLENYAYLPTAIMSVNETTGLPNYAQWNYRIVCSPIQRDIPTNFLKPVDDMAVRMKTGRSKEQILKSRQQRFKFWESDRDSSKKNSLLDDIFYSIPGKDNVPGHLNQSTFGEDMFTMDDQPLNTGYYHRFFKFAKPGAMGLTVVARGYNDANCWVAQTTQKRVAPMALKVCSKKWVKVKGKMRRRRVCEMMSTRFSYAIPLEIVYLTPLLSWNPYNLLIHQNKSGATTGDRTGGVTDPYLGVDLSHYYMTPTEFFSGRVDKSDKADTVRKKGVKVEDQNGNVHNTAASGTRIALPEIEGVGSVRLRYPIAPVHGEGSSVWKELNAAKALGVASTNEGPATNSVFFQMSTTYQDPPGEHTHEFAVSKDQVNAMMTQGLEPTVTTTEAQGHTHTLKIRYVAGKKRFEYTQCGSSTRCRDGHGKVVSRIDM